MPDAKPKSRSVAQNAMFHALCSEAAQTRQWAGRWTTLETWKRLFIAAWCRATGEEAQLWPALDGHGFDVIYQRSHQLSVTDMADLITYVQWWMDEHDPAAAPVALSIPSAPPPRLKDGVIKSRKMLDAAQGECCVACGTDDGTIVAAHYSGMYADQLGRGAGKKPDDIFCAHLCYACHQEFDQYSDGNSEDRAARFLIAVCKTIKRLWTKGVIKS